MTTLLRAKLRLLLLAVMVAAAIFAVTPSPPVHAQDGTADCGTGNPLHGRTQQVVDTIITTLGASECSAVTSVQLTGIILLSMNADGLTSLRDGDFDGLSGMQTLRLDNNFLTALPSGVFDGLPSLQQLFLHQNSLADLPSGVFDGLSSLRELYLYDNSLAELPSGVFDGLSSLQQLYLYDNALAVLPPDVFDGLSNLRQLHLNDNPLACVHTGQFDGLSELRLLHLDGTNLGNIAPSYFVRWALNNLDDLRFGGTAVGDSAIDFAAYQEVLPALDESKTFVGDSTDLSHPICRVEAAADCGEGNPLHGRTQKVVTAIIETLGVSECSTVTSAQLTGILLMSMNAEGLTSLRDGDFDGLSGMQTLRLDNNSLAALPSGAFDGLPSLRQLFLHQNSLVALPSGVFDGLPSLREVYLYDNSLAELASDLFDGVSTLHELHLYDNPLACVHAGQFDGLSELQLLRLDGTGLGNIAPSHFVRWGLNNLEELRFGGTAVGDSAIDFTAYRNVLPALMESKTFVGDPAELSHPICGAEPPADCGGEGNPLHGRTQQVVDAVLAELAASECSTVTSAQLTGVVLLNLNIQGLLFLRGGDFDGLSGLQMLYLEINSLTALPPDVFDGLSSLRELYLSDNFLAALPGDVFDGLSSLQKLSLSHNSLAALPPDVFDGLSSLRELYLHNNPLTCVHPEQFGGLSELQLLRLDGTDLGNIAPSHFVRWGLNNLEELRFGGTAVGDSAIDFAAYQNVLPALDESKTFVRDTADLSDPLCGVDPPADCGEGNPLHGRTQEVVDAIITTLAASECSAVTSTHLTGILLLSMNADGLIFLRDGDFDGLSGMQTLRLDNNFLATLPPDVFEGLPSLRQLFLNQNSLAALPSGVFDGLPSLRELYLYDNSLAALPPDLFDGLSGLQLLRLDDNPLACVHTGQFDGLSELQILQLNGTNLGNIAPSYFVRWGLTKLEALLLGSTAVGDSAVDFTAYKNVLPALEESRTYVGDTAELSHPICGEDCGGAGNPLHGRTPQVVDTIITTLAVSECSAVTSAQLTGILLLSMNTEGLTSLRDGDFDGLSRMQTLRLDNNSLAALPPDVFIGLSGLQQLFLNQNSLAELPSDVFDGLPSLRELYLYDNALAALPSDLFDGLSGLQLLRLDDNPLACVHTGQFDGLSELQILQLNGTNLGNIAPSYFVRWGVTKLEALLLGSTAVGDSAVEFAAYKNVLPALEESRTYVGDTADLSHPLCGSITADPDGNYHGTVRVSLEGSLVRPNRARATDAALLGDGVCTSDSSTTQHVLWTWQRSADGVAWTSIDMSRQPKAYGVRAEGECSFTYTPHADDDGMYIRAYVPVNTAGVGRHDYYTAAFGPLNLRP